MQHVDANTARSLYDTLVALGFEPTDEARHLCEAINDPRTPDVILAEAQNELELALADGDTDRLKAAQQAMNEARVIRATWPDIMDARDGHARKLSKLIADAAFEYVSKLYNDAGARFAKALKAVDIDADPAKVMLEDDKARRAFVSVPALVAELDALAALLVEIVTASGRRFRGNQSGYPLGLLVTLGDARVRRLVECRCWSGYTPARVNPRPPTAIDKACGGRGARWAGLVRFGATLAVPVVHLADYKPLEIAEYLPGGVDPYDGPAQWAQHEARTAAKTAAAARHAAAIRSVGGHA